MSAVLKAVEARFEPLAEQHLDAVLQIEQQAYAHPWLRANFSDSLRSGYQAQLLLADETLLGYFVAMKGVDEVHLLNISIVPELQHQGCGSALLIHLFAIAKDSGGLRMFLEVRRSNAGAQRLYLRHGFIQIGERRGYYPVQDGREDAIVMAREL